MIKFVLDVNDILAYNRHYAKLNAPFVQRYLPWALVAFFVLLVAYNLQAQKASGLSYLIIIPLLFLVVGVQVGLTNYLQRRALNNYVKKNPALVGPREYSFTDTEITVTVNGHGVSYPLSSIQQLEESKRHFYAYLSGQTAIIIPKRLLAQFDEAKQLVEKIRRSIQ